MRLFYVLINTGSLLRADCATEIDFEAMLNAVFKKLILTDQKSTHIFFYISHDSTGFKDSIKRYAPDWLTYEFVVRDPSAFSEAEADKIFSRKFRETDEVTQIKAIPEGILSKPQRDKAIDKMRSRWNWAYLYEIPKPELNTALI